MDTNQSFTGLAAARVSNQVVKGQKNITMDGQIQVPLIEMESGVPKPGVTVTEAKVVSTSCSYRF